MAAIPVALSGCRNPSTTREVIVYTSVDQPRSEPVFKTFETRYGIRIKAVYDVEASKTTGLANRLFAEARHPVADVFWSSEPIQTLALAEQGVLSSFESPAADRVPEALRDPLGRWIGLGLRARVILINTERVPTDMVPYTLFDLVDERWKAGEVGMALPIFGTSFTHAVVLYQVLGREKAESFFIKVKTRGIRILDGNARVAALVAEGRLKAGLTDTDDALSWIRKGAPLKMVFPKNLDDGGLIFPGTISLVAGAGHPAEARKLIDFLLSAEVEEHFISSQYFYSSIHSPHDVNPAIWQDISSKLPLVREEMRGIFIR